MTEQYTAWVARTTAVVAAGGACWAGIGHQWWLATGFAYVGLVAAMVGQGYAALHRTDQARHDRALQESGADGPPSRPEPCCSFWRNSNGAVHRPGCARFLEDQALHDGQPLDEREAAIFTAIADRYDQGRCP